MSATHYQLPIGESLWLQTIFLNCPNAGPFQIRKLKQLLVAWKSWLVAMVYPRPSWQIKGNAKWFLKVASYSNLRNWDNCIPSTMWWPGWKVQQNTGEHVKQQLPVMIKRNGISTCSKCYLLIEWAVMNWLELLHSHYSMEEKWEYQWIYVLIPHPPPDHDQSVITYGEYTRQLQERLDTSFQVARKKLQLAQ